MIGTRSLSIYAITFCLVLTGVTRELNAASLFGKKIKNIFRSSPLSLCLGGLDSCAESYAKEFEVINELLEQNVATDDAKANLDWAKSHLSEKLAAGKRSQKSLVQALELFTSLAPLLESDNIKIRCNIGNTETLDKCYKSVEDEGKAKTNRIGSIVESLALKHAKECPEFYRTQFDTLDQRMPENLKKYPENWLPTIVAIHMLREGQYTFPKGISEAETYAMDHPLEATAFVMEKMKHLSSSDDADILFQWMDAASFGKLDHNHLHPSDDVYLSSDKTSKMFNNYIINSCTDYMNWLDQVVLPLKFDLKFAEPTDIFPGSGENHPAMKSMLLFEMCKKVIENKDQLRKKVHKKVEWNVNVFHDGQDY